MKFIGLKKAAMAIVESNGPADSLWNQNIKSQSWNPQDTILVPAPFDLSEKNQ